jgi:hypothetical protein
MTNAIFYSLITCQITCVTTAPADRLHKVTRFKKNIYYNAFLRPEEKELYSRESAITGKTLPGPFLQNRTTYRNVRAPDVCCEVIGLFRLPVE